MNWKQIRKDYPKVDNHLEKWKAEHFFEDLNDRSLFDFFDENEIYVIPFIYSHDQSPFEINEWAFEIIKEGQQEIDEYDFKNRTEAETAAFTKAFEILENKLK